MIAAAPVAASPQPSLELEGAAIRALTAIGFHGALNGKPKAALRLFEALGELSPAAVHPRVGQALALIAMGCAGDAVQRIEAHGPTDAADDNMLAFLGLALQMAREEHRARVVLTAIAEGGGDPQARRLARQLLDHPT